MKTNTKFERGQVFTCGFLLMLCAGLVFSWSIFAGPIEAELGFTRQQTSLVFPFSLSISIFGQMVAGHLQKKIRLRHIFFITSALYLAGFLLAAQSTSIWQLYLGYGVLVGLAIGMVFNMILINVPAFAFPGRESFGTGLVLMGFGMGSMVLGTLAAGIIQTAGWRAVFIGFAVGYAVLSLLGGAIIPPAPVGEAAAMVGAAQDKSPAQLIKLPSYRIFFLWCVTLVMGALVASGHAALCAAELNPNPMVASTAVTVNALANVITRMALGYAYPRLGGKKCRWILTVFGLAGSVLCLLSYLSGSLAGLLGGFAILGSVNGGSAIVGTAYIRERFGRTHFGSNIAITNLHLAIASFLGPAVAGAIRTQTGSYSSVFLTMVLVAAVAAALLAIEIRWENRE